MYNFLDSLDLINLDFLDNETLEKVKLLVEHVYETINFDTRVSFDEIQVKRKPRVIINSKITINTKRVR